MTATIFMWLAVMVATVTGGYVVNKSRERASTERLKRIGMEPEILRLTTDAANRPDPLEPGSIHAWSVVLDLLAEGHDPDCSYCKCGHPKLAQELRAKELNQREKAEADA